MRFAFGGYSQNHMPTQLSLTITFAFYQTVRRLWNLPTSVCHHIV